MYRSRINSYNELPKDKRPPRDLWDKPYRLEQFFDEMFDRGGNEYGNSQQVLFDPDELE